MNVNFGLFPLLDTKRGGRERKKAYTQRAKADFESWVASKSCLKAS